VEIALSVTVMVYCVMIISCIINRNVAISVAIDLYTHIFYGPQHSLHNNWLGCSTRSQCLHSLSSRQLRLIYFFFKYPIYRISRLPSPGSNLRLVTNLWQAFRTKVIVREGDTLKMGVTKLPDRARVSGHCSSFRSVSFRRNFRRKTTRYNSPGTGV
jgi:hypothetical protein